MIPRLTTLLLTAALLAPAGAMAAPERLSVGTAGEPAAGASGGAAVSATGRFVAFASEAPNLVASDANGVADVFVRDRTAGTTSRVSVATGGAEGTGLSTAPSVSGDGRIVAFASRAADLVSADPNGTAIDVHLYDRATGRTTRVPLPGDRISFDPAVSADGRYVALAAERVRRGEDGDLEEQGPRRVYVWNVRTGTVRQVSVSSRERPAAGESGEPSISADGRYVAFTSTAAYLVPHDTRGKQDVFVRDRRRGTTTRASVSATGRQAGFSNYEPAISSDGRQVAFTTRSHDLERGDMDGATDIYVRDLRHATTRRISRGVTGWATAAAISRDGGVVAYQLSPTDLVADGDGPFGRVIVRTRSTGKNRALPGTRNGFPALSADGRLVAFVSGADVVATAR